jgi:hypothetical protein
MTGTHIAPELGNSPVTISGWVACYTGIQP